ncbi:MAG: hypothetical protein JJE25_06665 [Bacteroidia bacterium]|nr:hypothetical protein [Bacteroidia bacterium]
MREKRKIISSFCLAFCAAYLFLPLLVSAQNTQTGIPWTGAIGITQTVEQIIAQDTSHAAFNGQVIVPREHETNLHKANNPDAPDVPSYSARNHQTGAKSIVPTQTIGVNFLASAFGNTVGYVPPDCNGAVGPTQVMVVANGRVRVFSKSGTLGALDVTTDAFFSSVRAGSSACDSHIRYDRLSERWFVIAINVASTNNRVVIAVSSGPIITNSSSFTFYYFDFTIVSPAGDNGKFLDYPTLGVDANALYIGGVRFSPSSFNGCPVFVVRKSSVLSGGPIVVTAFRSAGGTGSGIYVPQGVDNDDPSATEGYFIGTDAGVYSKLNIIRVNSPGGTPSITTLPFITIPTNNNPVLQYHQGAASNRRLDGLDDRLFAAHVMKNKLTGVTSLWTAHATKVNSAGTASGTMDRNASRYYEIGNLTATPILLQAGTLYDNASSNPRGFWIPSIAMSGQGHAVMGFSTAGAANRNDAGVSGRYSVDAVGQLQAFALATSSSTSYNLQATDGQRWGDYSQVVVDPNDNMTMWTFQEYCNATNSWGVRVFQLIAPAPPPTASLNALPTVGITASVNVNIVANSTPGNTGFFEPGADAGGPGFANHITASATGSIAVNSVTFTDATHLTINLNTSASSPGTYTITITNPDGQSTTIPITINNALPVELINFTATINSDVCLLNWVTASEINNNYFIVERSFDGIIFSEIGQINGAGNSTTVLNYSFTDEHPYPGISFYRLRQVDFDGTSVFSEVVHVNFKREDFALISTLTDFQNQTIKIFFNNNMVENFECRVVDIPGRTICSGEGVSVKGVGSFTINCKHLSHGMYYLTLSNGKKTLTGKIFF